MKLLFISICLVFCACGPDGAKVEQNLFPVTESKPLSASSIEDANLANSAWFLWGKEDDMSTVLRLSAYKKQLGVKAAELKGNLQQTMISYQSFMVENMGADNFALLADYEDKIVAAEKIIAESQTRLDEEMAKPERDRDASVIRNMKSRIKRSENDKADYLAEINVLLDTYLPAEEKRQQMALYKTTMAQIMVGLGEIQKQGEDLVAKLSKLVDLNMNAPTLVIQSRENGLFISLEGFGVDDSTPCSTEVGNIFDVKIDLPKGLMEFKALCKQRQADLVDLFIFQLEKVSAKPFVMSGNIARCTDQAPNRGTCQAGIRYGVIEFQSVK